MWKLNANFIIINYNSNFAHKQTGYVISILIYSWFHNGPVIGTAQHNGPLYDPVRYVPLGADNRSIMKSAICKLA